MLSAETISERSDDRERWKRRVSYIHSELVVPLVSAEWITASNALNVAAEQLVRAGQLLTVARATEPDDQPMAGALGQAAASMAHEALETISAYLVDNGIADVLEDQARTIAKYLQVGDLPEQDSNALRRCGSGAPDIELELSLERLKDATKDKDKDRDDDEPVRSWEEAVAAALEVLGVAPPADRGPRRLWFKTVSAIVRGSVLLAVDGGLLTVAAAPVALASPPPAAGVLGSLALGFNDVVVSVSHIPVEDD